MSQSYAFLKRKEKHYRNDSAFSVKVLFYTEDVAIMPYQFL